MYGMMSPPLSTRASNSAVVIGLCLFEFLLIDSFPSGIRTMTRDQPDPMLAHRVNGDVQFSEQHPQDRVPRLAADVARRYDDVRFLPKLLGLDEIHAVAFGV